MPCMDDVTAQAEAAELFLLSIRQMWNGRMDASAMGGEAKALQHSLLDEALSIVARGLPPIGPKQKRIHGLS